jgi:hypothetical protein
MKGFLKAKPIPPRADASGPVPQVDDDKAKRAIWWAKKDAERNARAWDRRPESTSTDEEAAPKPARVPFVSRPLAGCAADQVATISAEGVVHRVSDNDLTDRASLMETQSGRFFARVESVLQSICRDETGQFETEEETKNRREKEERLKRQGSIICDALESQGVVGYRSDAWQLVGFGVHSHEITEIPAYRRICLNPYVAHRLRLPYLNWLQYFAQGREKSLRFWTFTTGKRVLIHRLGARIKWLHRRISELNAEPFMIEAGIRIVFRATEFGTLETDTPDNPAQDGETGGSIEGAGPGRWYHPHAHCIVWLSKGKLPAWQWSALLERVWKFWHHNWDEGARIRNMREAVKYVVKPGDMVRLAEECPKELVRLSEVLFRKKLVQPMAELALQMRAADRAGLIPALRWKDDVQKWTLIADPNRNRFADGSRGSGLYGSDGVKADFRAAMDDAQVPTPTELTNTAAARHFGRDRYGVKPQDVQVCRVVARCSPAFNSRGVKEPRVIVCGSYFDRTAVLAHPLVRRMVSATRAAYDAGVMRQASERGGLALLGERGTAPARTISVHTGTPTVPVLDPGPMLWDPPEAHCPEFAAELARN